MHAFPKVGVQPLRAAYTHLAERLSIDALVLAYRDAVAHAQEANPLRPSIVNGQIAAAIRGELGNVQFTRRTRDSPLFVNPLMAVYFTVELDSLAERCLYLDRIGNTYGMRQVAARIQDFRNDLATRILRAFPQ